MATTNYQLDIVIERPVEEVFSFFCDLKNHVHLHPLLTKVGVEDRFENEEGQIVTVFKLEETIKVLGWFSMPNTYIAHRVLLEEQNTCIFSVKTFPNIHLSSSYVFLKEGNQRTKIKEEVNIQAPFGMSGFVTKTAKNAHATLLKALKQYLERAETNAISPRG